MVKADELRNPTSCLNRAEANEPVFVLRAKDPIAAQTVRLWAAMASGMHEQDKQHEAKALADQMDAWRTDFFAPKAEAAVIFPNPPYQPMKRG